MGEVFARRYELLDPIADGGMGSVWRVRDHLDGDVKAAKLLRQSDAGTLLRFMREQSTRIHHAHVVTPYSWAGEDDTVLFTMPLVRGGSVATLVGDWGPLPEPWVTAVLDQTLDALEAVHAAGVVHRDVKPANLLLEPTGSAPPHVRLTDFGIAAPVDQPRMTAGSTALGTPGYMAPEQSAGADPDPRQDLYAVATVGLEMLLGHPPPFTDDEVPDSALAARLAAVRHPDPGHRPATATAMREDLRRIAPREWDPGDVEVLDHFATATGAPLEPRSDPATAVLQVRPAVGATPRPAGRPTAPTAPTAPGAALPVLLAVLGLALLVASGWLLLG